MEFLIFILCFIFRNDTNRSFSLQKPPRTPISNGHLRLWGRWRLFLSLSYVLSFRNDANCSFFFAETSQNTNFKWAFNSWGRLRFFFEFLLCFLLGNDTNHLLSIFLCSDVLEQPFGTIIQDFEVGGGSFYLYLVFFFLGTLVSLVRKQESHFHGDNKCLNNLCCSVRCLMFGV